MSPTTGAKVRIAESQEYRHRHRRAVPSRRPPGTRTAKKCISYQEAILQETLPKSVIIIGAGAIGVEFATIWNSYGTKVTLVEMLPQMLPLADEEASAGVGQSIQKARH